MSYVAEMEAGIPDESVLDRANESEALLLTSDKDFGELVFRQSKVTAGVVLIRLPGLSADKKTNIVSHAFAEHHAEFPGCFSVITANRVRIRQAGILRDARDE